MIIERMLVPTEFKILDEDKRTIEGYAATFGNIDYGNDKIFPGAFTKTIAEKVAKGAVKLFYAHSYDTPYNLLGTVTGAFEDTTGLHYQAALSKAPSVDDVVIKMREGHLDKSSIGYDVPKGKSEIVKEGDQFVREIYEMRVHEISLVPIPMNDQTSAYLKALQMKQQSTEVQTVICSKSKFDSAEAARAWCREHDFSTSKIDETEDSYRFRQFDPGQCQDDSFRTISITSGVSAVICKRKEKALLKELILAWPEEERDTFLAELRAEPNESSLTKTKSDKLYLRSRELELRLNYGGQKNDLARIGTQGGRSLL